MSLDKRKDLSSGLVLRPSSVTVIPTGRTYDWTTVIDWLSRDHPPKDTERRRSVGTQDPRSLRSYTPSDLHGPVITGVLTGGGASRPTITYTIRPRRHFVCGSPLIYLCVLFTTHFLLSLPQSFRPSRWSGTASRLGVPSSFSLQTHLRRMWHHVLFDSRFDNRSGTRLQWLLPQGTGGPCPGGIIEVVEPVTVPHRDSLLQVGFRQLPKVSYRRPESRLSGRPYQPDVPRPSADDPIYIWVFDTPLSRLHTRCVKESLKGRPDPGSTGNVIGWKWP